MNLTTQHVEFLRKQHIRFGLPCYAGLVHECVLTSMLNFSRIAQQLGMSFSVETMTNESLIPRGRNHITAKFLADSFATHLMFIDSDIGFAAEHIIKLILHDKDIVGGLYPKKALPPDYVVNVSPEDVDQNGQVRTENGLMPVSRLGTGFLLVKRHVFEQHMAAYPNTKFTNNIGLDPKYDPFCYTFWDCWVTQDDKREYVSEDWGFCIKSRVIGIQAWADSSIRLNHSGTFVFPGDPTQLYNSMGLNSETQTQLRPKIAMRPDEIKDDSAKLTVQPNLESLAAYKDLKEREKNIVETLNSNENLNKLLSI